MKNVTLKQLRILAAVSKTGSMAAAARELNVTPPAITMQMQLLEQMIGLPVIERTGEKTAPTTAGEKILKASQRIQAILSECDQEIGQLKGIRGGRISVGVVSTAKYFAPRALAAFRDKHPGVEVRLLVSNRQETIRLLECLELDVAIMGRPPENLDLDSEVIGDHPHVIVGCGDHPLAFTDLKIHDLSSENFFVRELGSGTRSLMERFFEESGFSPRIGMEIGSNETIKQAVKAGLGIAFISAHTVAPEIERKEVAVLHVAGLPITRQWFVVRLRDKKVMPAADAIWKFLATKGRNFLAEPPNLRI